jgi:hypothetical protein
MVSRTLVGAIPRKTRSIIIIVVDKNREPQSRSMCPRKEGIIAVGEIVDMMLDGTLCECKAAFPPATTRKAAGL